MVLGLWLLWLPVQPLHNAQEVVDLGPKFRMNGLFALVLQLGKIHLRGELEPAGSTPIDLFFDLVAALVDRLEDASLEVPMIGLQSIFEVCTKLSSL